MGKVGLLHQSCSFWPNTALISFSLGYSRHERETPRADRRPEIKCTMNAIRSSSASASLRRLVATPPPPPIGSSARLLSSSSFTPALLSKRSHSSNPLSSSHRVAASSRWSGTPPSLYFTQIRTMASDGKIKVKNPVVELDGDEVSVALLFYSPNSRKFGPYHKPASSRIPVGHFCPVCLQARGNTGQPWSSCANHPRMSLQRPTC